MISVSLSHRQMKIVKVVGYPLFFIVCFVFFVGVTFPAERYVPTAERRLSHALGRNVSIGGMSVSAWGAIGLHDVRISLPVDTQKDADADLIDEGEDGDGDGLASPNDMMPEYLVPDLRIDVSLMSLLMGRMAFDVDMEVAQGSVRLSYKGQRRVGTDKEKKDGELDKSPDEKDDPSDAAGFTLAVDASDLNLAQIVDLQSLLPLPMLGRLGMSVKLSSPTGRLKDAEGTIQLSGANVSLGQGQSKVEVVKGMGPMTVESISVDALELNMVVKKGIAGFKKNVFQSSDMDVFFEGDLRLNDPFSSSRANIYLAFKLLDAYGEKSQYAQTLVSMLPTALSTARRVDGYFGYHYSGSLKNAKFRPRKHFAAGTGGRQTATRTTARTTGRRPLAPSSREKRPAVGAAPQRIDRGAPPSHDERATAPQVAVPDEDPDDEIVEDASRGSVDEPGESDEVIEDDGGDVSRRPTNVGAAISERERAMRKATEAIQQHADEMDRDDVGDSDRDGDDEPVSATDE